MLQALGKIENLLLGKYVEYGESLLERIASDPDIMEDISNPTVKALKSLTSLRPKYDSYLSNIRNGKMIGVDQRLREENKTSKDTSTVSATTPLNKREVVIEQPFEDSPFKNFDEAMV